MYTPSFVKIPGGGLRIAKKLFELTHTLLYKIQIFEYYIFTSETMYGTPWKISFQG